LFGGGSILLPVNELSNGWTSREIDGNGGFVTGWRTMMILSELELVELCVLGDVLWKRADVDL
jgi:hypothetical protein